MKVKAPSLMKKIMTALSNKTNELRIRLMIFFLLHKSMNKTTLTHTFTSKNQTLVPYHTHHHLTKKNDDFSDVENDQERQILLLQDEEVKNKASIRSSDNMLKAYYSNVIDGGYNSLTHALFKESEAAMEEEVEEDHGGGSGGGVVVDAAEMVVDEDIDRAADLFIQRFKREIQLQKLHSLEKNHLQLLHANV